jgi:hypothetical protein
MTGTGVEDVVGGNVVIVAEGGSEVCVDPSVGDGITLVFVGSCNNAGVLAGAELQAAKITTSPQKNNKE